MVKNIVIIGGGISGLAVLHNLMKKYRDRPDVRVQLFEKNEYLGGTIRSIHADHCLFETGPNGFLDSKETTLEFVRELGLENDLLRAGQQAQKRFIYTKGQLHKLPENPLEFLSLRFFSLPEKIRILKEMIIPSGTVDDESVYSFGERRFGASFSKMILDPMVSGVFAGDAKAVHLKSAFPRIYEIEQKYGSLFKGMSALAKEKRKKSLIRNLPGQPAGRLTSFSAGMSRLIQALHDRYEGSIQTGHAARSITRKDAKFIVNLNTKDIEADEVFLCTPAYNAAEIVKPCSANLTRQLQRITYAPVAVIGLIYKRMAFKKTPEGFGYLIPSCESNGVLGVLFSSNIFEGRSDPDYFLFRVMVGGAKHPDVVSASEERLLELARNEIQKTLDVRGFPENQVLAVHPLGIPQYTKEYPDILKNIEIELNQNPGVYLAANYIGGVSFNDCISTARDVIQRSRY